MKTSTHDPLAWIDSALAELERDGLRRQLAVRSGPQTSRVILDGRELINFGSNDYLGLAADQRVTAAARAASEREGWGSGASPLVSGRGEAHAELERRLAEFEGTEAALVFPSGFAANAGVIPALVDEPDAIFGDAKNHASLIDGCRLAKAARFVYPHGDCDALEMLLRKSAGYRRRLIVTDTVFSMDGDIAPLAQLAELAEQYSAMLMVDEAHATGVFGERGCGIVEHAGLHDRVHIRVGTLSKALGSGGGFACGRQSLIDWLANRARTYVFSTAQPAATSAAALAALDIVREESHRRVQLLERSADFRRRLRADGWNVAGSESQIIPIVIGDTTRTMRLAAQLREAGFFVPGIRPPSVPDGESLLRISFCYHHTPEIVDALVKQLAAMR
ncbi:MAG: 8-amino-7-oxononanoate synthase [Planctomycetes bacterium]|nr:8-amino-7-oxononanoate synthase [Planctomycetota bacterium]